MNTQTPSPVRGQAVSPFGLCSVVDLALRKVFAREGSLARRTRQHLVTLDTLPFVLFKLPRVLLSVASVARMAVGAS